MRYLEPETVGEALDLLAEHGDEAKVIAGGQSLLLLMRERLVAPEALIGLRAIEPLRAIEVNGGGRGGARGAPAPVAADPRPPGRWPPPPPPPGGGAAQNGRERRGFCGDPARAGPP